MKEKIPNINSSDTPRFKIAQGILDSQWRLRKSVKEPSRQSRECGIPEIKKGECFRIAWLVRLNAAERVIWKSVFFLKILFIYLTER